MTKEAVRDGGPVRVTGGYDPIRVADAKAEACRKLEWAVPVWSCALRFDGCVQSDDATLPRSPGGLDVMVEVRQVEFAQYAAGLVVGKTPRDYQRAAFERTLKEGTVLNMGTGLGKTLCASLAISHYLRSPREQQPRQRALVMFVVQTVVLVEQQAQEIERDVAPLPHGRVKCLQLSGNAADTWDANEWQHAQDSHDVVVGTAQLLHNALVNAYIDIGRYELVIFDECHHAKKNSPMANISRWMLRTTLPEGGAPKGAGDKHAWDAAWDSVVRRATPWKGRILGLTASWELGRVDNEADLHKKRVALEALLQAALYVPPGLPGKRRSSKVVYYKQTITGRHFEMVEKVMREGLFKRFNELLARQRSGRQILGEQVKKLKRQWEYNLKQLGLAACELYVEKALIRALHDALRKASEYAAYANFAEFISELPEFQRLVVKPFTEELRNLRQVDPDDDATVPSRTHKLDTLCEHLLGLFFEAHARKGNYSYKGIVFVQETALAVPLQLLLQRAFDDDPYRPLDDRRVRVEAYTGVLPREKQRAVVEAFKSGKARLLVSTAATEEGFNVTDCAFVACFSAVQQTKAFIQRKGRARMEGCTLLYFEDDPGEHARKEQMLKRTAADDTLACAPTARASYRQRVTAKEKPGVHPYEPGLDVYSGVSIVTMYVAACLRTAGGAGDKLLFHDGNPQREHGDTNDAFVRVPTPRGWLKITYDDADELFGKLPDPEAPEEEVQLTIYDYLPADAKLKGGFPGELRKVLYYIAAVRLRQQGFVGGDFKATDAARHPDTRVKCPLPAEYLAALDAKLPLGVPPACEENYQALPNPPHSGPAYADPALPSAAGNHVGRLQELSAAAGKGAPEYSMTPDAYGRGFSAKCTADGCSVEGAPAPRQVSAKQEAAWAWLQLHASRLAPAATQKSPAPANAVAELNLITQRGGVPQPVYKYTVSGPDAELFVAVCDAFDKIAKGTEHATKKAAKQSAAAAWLEAHGS
eukprot:TRINITY_DN1159_c0_g2_i6.p1 TRINITY_DN1159_c0_g2~~TRINITY_DN1159_c0_g2_i6.p1  ORF type:complete len:988 (+),score=262.62 TRINITY_DN1159_c0_g2_i6:50-3013(+)